MSLVEKEKKPAFTSRLGFLATASGSAVGLGNILFFPAQTSDHGGGVFLLIYLGFVVILGYPLLLGKLALGRAHKGSPYCVYRSHRKWKWFAFIPALVAFCIYAFYNVIAGWLLIYGWKLASGLLFQQENFQEVFKVAQSNLPSNLLATLLVFLFVAFISRAGVNGGIERLSRILMPLFIVIMLLLIAYAFTFEGAGAGLSFFLKPSWSTFFQNYKKALLVALGQSFMSLSIGAGQMVTYGAYADKKEPLRSSAAIIVASDTLVAILAGLFLFPFICAQGIAPSAKGETLAFVCLPPIFQQLGPWIGTFVGLLFFLLLGFAAITSSVSLIEVPIKYLQERFGWKRKCSVYVTSVAAFLVSVGCILGRSGHAFFANVYGGHHFMEILHWVTSNIGMPFVALFFSFFAAHFWKVKALLKELEKSDSCGPRFAQYLKITLTYIVPLLIGSTLVMSLYDMGNS